MHGRGCMTIEPSILQCRDGTRRVFDDQAGILLHQARSETQRVGRVE